MAHATSRMGHPRVRPDAGTGAELLGLAEALVGGSPAAHPRADSGLGEAPAHLGRKNATVPQEREGREGVEVVMLGTPEGRNGGPP